MVCEYSVKCTDYCKGQVLCDDDRAIREKVCGNYKGFKKEDKEEASSLVKMVSMPIRE